MEVDFLIRQCFIFVRDVTDGALELIVNSKLSLDLVYSGTVNSGVVVSAWKPTITTSFLPR
jgi:ABC-type transport system involved in cytochrome c biogenesis permease component